MRLACAACWTAQLPTRKERWYALTAHLNFVVTDEATLRPVFAVEYDGPDHEKFWLDRHARLVFHRACDRYPGRGPPAGQPRLCDQ
jgi:hypothetical protein